MNSVAIEPGSSDVEASRARGTATRTPMWPPRTTAAAPSPVPGCPAVTATFDATDGRSVGAARRFVRRHCEDWRVDEAATGDALGIVSELATNAHVHSGSARFTVTVIVASTPHGPVLHVEVADRGTWPATPRDAGQPDGLPEHGRGWQYVAGCAVTCGIAHDPGSGTRAWAHVRTQCLIRTPRAAAL